MPNKHFIQIGDLAIVIPEEIIATKECVFKLWYGDSYIISMAKSLARGIELIHNDLSRFLRNTNKKPDKNNLFYKLYCFVQDNPDESFFIELTYVGSSPYQLLKHCQIELDKSFGDPNCLNTQSIPYISKSIQTKHNTWWINRGTYLNFRRWQKKYRPLLQNNK